MDNANQSLTCGWQAGFLALLPAVRTHARIQFRKLSAEKREEAIQATIASACVSYQLLAAQGRLHDAHPGTLASFAVKFVRNGRHVGGRQDAATDVLSPVAHRRHGVRLFSLNAGGSQTPGETWKDSLVLDRRTCIPDLAAFRIDFGEWLMTLSLRDRKIIALLAQGERTMAVADRFGLSEGRVSQLRRKYEWAWRAFQGEWIAPAA